MGPLAALLLTLAVAPAPPVPAAPADRVEAASLDRAVERIGALAGVRTVHLWQGERRLAARAFRGAGFGPHDVKSASKSVLSALVGIAIERRLLPGLDATIAELLPRESAALDPVRRGIRLRHLLSMSSGLASTSGVHYGRWVSSRDWMAAALARPLVAAPGEEFVYSTGSSHLVAAALDRACHCDLLEWGREVLFDPLGIEIASWAADPRGVRFGGNSFRIAPEALGRFGQLYLAGGEWGGRRIVPRDWIGASTRRHAEGWPDRYGAYGLLWWIPPFERERAYMAVGYGGQFLIVAPASGAVVVITATHVGKGKAWDRELLGRIERELLPLIGR